MSTKVSHQHKGRAGRGERHRDAEALQTAVLERCAEEFAGLNPIPGVVASRVRFFIESFAGNEARNRRARQVLRDLQAALDASMAIVREHRENYSGGFPGRFVDALAGLEDPLHQFAAALASSASHSAKWAEEMGEPASTDGGPLDAVPLTGRQAVLMYFAQAQRGAAMAKAVPNPRHLAITSLLAGQSMVKPSGRGLTVSEVIIGETRAMREALRTWVKRQS